MNREEEKIEDDEQVAPSEEGEVNPLIKKAIEHFGGEEKMAVQIGVSQPAVSKWLHSKPGTGISPANAAKVDRKTGGLVRKEELLPSFPWEVFSQDTPAEEAAQ